MECKERILSHDAPGSSQLDQQIFSDLVLAQNQQFAVDEILPTYMGI